MSNSLDCENFPFVLSYHKNDQKNLLICLQNYKIVLHLNTLRIKTSKITCVLDGQK